MLNKDLDLTIVGNSYISYLLAFQMLQDKKEVLVLDDDRLHVDESHFRVLSHVEFNFVKSWADELDVSTLMNFDEFVSPDPFVLRFASREIILGRDCPYSNLLELTRKVPGLFGNLEEFLLDEKLTNDTFNELYLNTCQRIGDSLCKYKTIGDLSYSTLSSLSDLPLISLFSKFYETINNGKEDDDISLFLYASRSIFYEVLSFSQDKMELFHLFISLLSPRYEFDSTRVIKHLKHILELRGGQFRKSQIKDWSFSAGKPWCLVLDSYEGIVRPLKVVFIGGSLSRMPVRFENEKSYGNYLVKLNCDATFIKQYPTYNFKTKYMGTNFVSWLVGSSNGQQYVDICAIKGSCEKPEFARENITELLLRNDIIKDASEVGEITHGDSVTGIGCLNVSDLSKSVNLVDCSSALNQKKIKNVYYFGPCQRSPLGLLTTFMQTQDYRKFF